MSAYSETLLAARFAALEPETFEGDWLDVQRRLRRGRRRRSLVLAAAAVLAAIIAGSALAFGPRALDFFAADPAPARVARGFAQTERTRLALWGDELPAVGDEARTIVDLDLGGGEKARVFATPRRGGAGFCYAAETPSWTLHGECVSRAFARSSPLQPNAYGGFLESDPQQDRGWRYLAGYVAPRATVRLEVRYEDGSTEVIPFVWVGEPIGAGFFAFDPGAAHERPGSRATQLVALGADQRTLARYAFGYRQANDPWDWPPRATWPKAIDPTTAHVLRFPGAGGNVHKVRVARVRNGKAFCWEARFAGGGCSSPRTHWFHGVGLSASTNGTFLLGNVAPQVASLELRFEDGSRALTYPQEQIVLYEIPARQFPPGRRLVRATYLNRHGRAVGRTRFDSKENAYYPGG